MTNGLRLATLLMEQSSARVLVLGGVLRRSAGSLVGPIGDVLCSRGRITKGFFGLVGLSIVHGLMDISAEEAQTKRVMAAACDEVHGLFDSTKITGFGLHPFAATERVTGLWTDDGRPPSSSPSGETGASRCHDRGDSDIAPRTWFRSRRTAAA